MSNKEIIAKIKAEIERRTKELDEQIVDIYDSKAVLRKDELQKLLPFLSTLEIEEYVELSSSVDNYPKNVCPPSVECEKGMREPLESEKPINPKANAKFKEGDWIKSKRHGKVAQVIMLLRDCYSLKTLDNDGLWLDYNFQDTWELIKEPSEKPMNQDGLNKEIENCLWKLSDDPSNEELCMFARHFAEWGYLRAAEKYDEIEYNRQRAEENVQNDIEEAANNYLDGVYGKMPHSDYHIAIFIAGAKWQEEQDQETIELAEDHSYLAGAVNEREKMLKEAVEGEIFDDYDKDTCEHHLTILSTVPSGYKDGDKIRIIIVKEDKK